MYNCTCCQNTMKYFGRNPTVPLLNDWLNEPPCISHGFCLNLFVVTVFLLPACTCNSVFAPHGINSQVLLTRRIHCLMRQLWKMRTLLMIYLPLMKWECKIHPSSSLVSSLPIWLAVAHPRFCLYIVCFWNYHFSATFHGDSRVLNANGRKVWPFNVGSHWNVSLEGDIHSIMEVSTMVIELYAGCGTFSRMISHLMNEVYFSRYMFLSYA